MQEKSVSQILCQPNFAVLADQATSFFFSVFTLLSVTVRESRVGKRQVPISTRDGWLYMQLFNRIRHK